MFFSLGALRRCNIFLKYASSFTYVFRKCQKKKIVYNDAKSLAASTFDPNKVTVLTIHGWGGNINSSVNSLLKKGLLHVEDVNVIVVDWEKVASSGYVTAVLSVPAVGRGVGQFIEWLTTYGLSYDKVHVIGHSLGAHVAGNAGSETKSQVRRITGLDPAGPLWKVSHHRLTKSDAQYVEAIHTNTKCLGYDGVCGDADFFPNGGENMPGCKSSSCSHNLPVKYMYQSIMYNNITALSCTDMEEVHADECNGTPYLMGNNDLTKNRSGIFRVNINKMECENSGSHIFVIKIGGYECRVEKEF